MSWCLRATAPRRASSRPPATRRGRRPTPLSSTIPRGVIQTTHVRFRCGSSAPTLILMVVWISSSTAQRRMPRRAPTAVTSLGVGATTWSATTPTATPSTNASVDRTFLWQKAQARLLAHRPCRRSRHRRPYRRTQRFRHRRRCHRWRRQRTERGCASSTGPQSCLHRRRQAPCHRCYPTPRQPQRSLPSRRRRAHRHASPRHRARRHRTRHRLQARRAHRRRRPSLHRLRPRRRRCREYHPYSTPQARA